MLIRRATSEDLPAASRVAWESFEAKLVSWLGTEGNAEYRRFSAVAAMQERLEEGNAFWLGLDQGEPVAMAETRDGSHLVMLFIHPEHFGKGLGSAMLARVLAADQEARGASGTWTVSSSPNAVGFYFAAGFVATGPEQIKNGIRFVPMTRENPELH